MEGALEALPGPQVVVRRDGKLIAIRFADQDAIEAEPGIFQGMPLVTILCSCQRDIVVGQKAYHIPMSTILRSCTGAALLFGRLQSQ